MKRRMPREDKRYRLTARHQVAEALRLCRGMADQKTLLNLCPWLNLKGAIEMGLLVERRFGAGQRTYIAGPKFKEGKCRRSNRHRFAG